MSGLSTVLQYLPTVATALANPVAGVAELAADFIGKKMGLSDSSVEGVKNALSGMTPADLLKQKSLDAELQEHLADNGIKLQMAQIAVNQAEAASANWFVAGWRPAVGWICAVAFGYSYVLYPFMEFAIKVVHPSIDLSGMPKLDLSDMMPVLLGMLGLGTMRTYEKRTNTEANR